jgi:hypothetical protein
MAVVTAMRRCRKIRRCRMDLQAGAQAKHAKPQDPAWVQILLFTLKSRQEAATSSVLAPLTAAAPDSVAERLLVMSRKFATHQVLLALSLFAILGYFVLASPAQAASVYNCSVSGGICVVKVEEGIIGDRVKVMDEKARVIAYGRIIKRRGYYAQVSITNSFKTIRKGYPVIVDLESRDSNMQWAASFSRH